MFSFKRCLNLKPDQPKIWYTKAKIHGKIEEYEEAVNDLAMAIKYKNSFADAWYFRGAFLAPLGRYKETEMCLDSALHYDPKLVDKVTVLKESIKEHLK
ncbi:MAG: hypothetical protein KAR42_12635 [candidate division Zixibacteria bacterium]|nr:hypothetical protein [candidate division Zixibacteria bacterium]